MPSKIRTAVVATTGMAALGVGLGIAGLASADPTASSTPSSTPSASSSPAAPGERPGGPGRGGDREGGLASALADKLGVEQAEVRTALQEYREANRPTTKADRRAHLDGEDDAALAAALAEDLDVDLAKVKAALAELRADRQAERAKLVDERLAAAVTDGTLTQAEADAVRKAAEAGVVHVGRR